MRHPQAIPAVMWLLLASGPGFFTGCGWIDPSPKKTVAATELPEISKYDRLAAKAEAGDAGAARDLAKWCYVHDDNNERAKHWLDVAARNGDKSAGKVADYVQDWR